jgi:hypothetical protein
LGNISRSVGKVSSWVILKQRCAVLPFAGWRGVCTGKAPKASWYASGLLRKVGAAPEATVHICESLVAELGWAALRCLHHSPSPDCDHMSIGTRVVHVLQETTGHALAIARNFSFLVVFFTFLISPPGSSTLVPEFLNNPARHTHSLPRSRTTTAYAHTFTSLKRACTLNSTDTHHTRCGSRAPHPQGSAHPHVLTAHTHDTDIIYPHEKLVHRVASAQ